eukprot:gene132-179_t
MKRATIQLVQIIVFLLFSCLILNSCIHPHEMKTSDKTTSSADASPGSSQATSTKSAGAESEVNETIMFYGSPGVGKSALCNAIFQKTIFKSEVSSLAGTTNQQTYQYQYGDKLYIDTPGLLNTNDLQVEKEIAETFNRHQGCKLIFVATTVCGRHRASQVWAINNICNTLKFPFEYGLIYNQVTEPVKAGMMQNISLYLSAFIKKPYVTLILTRDKDIEDKDNVYFKEHSENRANLLCFLHNLRPHHPNASDIIPRALPQQPLLIGQVNEVIMFCGNPGVGKSSLCNSVFQKALFSSGVSSVTSLTTQQQTYQYGDKLYIDTPGLADVNTREQAAKEIEQALKKNNNYKIVFVATIESGRLRPTDVSTIETVCDAIKVPFEYGLVFNKVSNISKSTIIRNGLGRYLRPFMNKGPCATVILEHDMELCDTPNVFYKDGNKNREALLRFLHDLPPNKIDAPDVTLLKTANEQERLQQLELENKRQQEQAQLAAVQRKKELEEKQKQIDEMEKDRPILNENECLATTFLQRMACGFILLLSLQNCSNFTKLPVVHEGKHDDELSTQSILDKALVAAGGHQVTLYQAETKLKANVKVHAPQGFFKTYHGALVTMEQGVDLFKLSQLDKQTQKRRILFNPPKNDQPAHVMLCKDSGLLGGGPNEVIVFLGNPGVGKSALCNAIFQASTFPSGLSDVTGMTTHEQQHEHGDKLYIDTPGLADAETREQAAKEIEKALKKNNNYKIIFVATLEACRVKNEDVTTIETVCNAIQVPFEYGLIFNKVSNSAKINIMNTGLERYLKPFTKKPYTTGILEFEHEIFDMSNVYFKANSKNRESLLFFLNNVKSNRINASDIIPLDVTNYKTRVEQLELEQKKIGEEYRTAQEEHRKQVEQLNDRIDHLKRENNAFWPQFGVFLGSAVGGLLREISNSPASPTYGKMNHLAMKHPVRHINKHSISVLLVWLLPCVISCNCQRTTPPSIPPSPPTATPKLAEYPKSTASNKQAEWPERSKQSTSTTPLLVNEQRRKETDAVVPILHTPESSKNLLPPIRSTALSASPKQNPTAPFKPANLPEKHVNSSNVPIATATENLIAPNEVILFLGNPGVGKSMLCNTAFQTPIFNSGLSDVTGLTTHEQQHQHGDKLYVDTPGLDDTKTREQAAKEIEKALKKNNNYKIVFIATLESCRVRPADAATIETVCNAIKTPFEYGLIFNKASNSAKIHIMNAGLERYLRPFTKKPYVTAILTRDDVLEDKSNVYFKADSENRRELLSLLDSIPTSYILASNIVPLDITNYKARVEQLELEQKRQAEAYKKQAEANLKEIEERTEQLKELKKQAEQMKKLKEK